MLRAPFWFSKSRLVMVHMKNVNQSKKTALSKLGTDSGGKKETKPYRELSQPLGEHRPLAPKKPRKDSQKEFEQAALYFANGWVWNSRKQERLSCSLHSEKKWAGDLWHLRPPCVSQTLWPWPLNIPGSWSQAPPEPKAVNYLCDVDKHPLDRCFSRCGLRTPGIRMPWRTFKNTDSWAQEWLGSIGTGPGVP